MVDKEMLKLVKCPWGVYEEINERRKSPVPIKPISIQNTRE